MSDVTCPTCGHEVPEGTFCVRCGAPLGGSGAPARKRGEFAAAPGQRLSSPRLVSTLFPQLPRADMATFQSVLGLGVAAVVVLALLRFFPVAVTVAALLVPLLVLIYLYDVDIYEDEPFRVVAQTMGWGILVGVGVALLTQAVTDDAADVLANSRHHDVLSTGVLLPLLGYLLALGGPLVLLRYKHFNDVLDGVTFGAASAVAYSAALVLTTSVDVYDAGLRPDGDIAPWVVRVLAIAVASPILVMAVVGAVAAAFWLRFRAPVGDRAKLGWLGRPPVAVVLGAVLVVAGSVGQPLLKSGFWIAALVVLDAIALIWLRRAIHLGLLEEASEIEIGPPIKCANCGHDTAKHSFCSNCGISLQALPKAKGTHGPAASGGPAEAGT